MLIIKTIKDMQKYSQNQRINKKKIGVVPTMGFLHQGHLSLIERAKSEADIVVVTIFVNPTQFGPNEDLDKYPRDFEKDSELCKIIGVDVIFAPEADEMYSSDNSTWVIEEKLSLGLCGGTRPTHFRGVTSVVTKLFNAVLPDVAIFGQKDAQQSLIIRRMVRDLNFPIEIIVSPIVRESDGLAMSSRNKYLSTNDRKNALSISSSIFEAETKIKNSDVKPSEIIEFIINKITFAGGKIDYVEVKDSATLENIEIFENKEVLIAVAAFFGSTRLIDNILIKKG